MTETIEPADDVREVLHELIVLHDPRGLARPVGAVNAILSDPRIEVRPRGTVTDAEVDAALASLINSAECYVGHTAQGVRAALEAAWEVQP